MKIDGMNIDFSELRESASSDADASASASRLIFVAGALGALSVALLIALIAVCIALVQSKGAPPPLTPAAPKFTISSQAFGQYTRILIRNDGTPGPPARPSARSAWMTVLYDLF
jgi:hypothetical protein